MSRDQELEKRIKEIREQPYMKKGASIGNDVKSIPEIFINGLRMGWEVGKGTIADMMYEDPQGNLDILNLTSEEARANMIENGYSPEFLDKIEKIKTQEKEDYDKKISEVRNAYRDLESMQLDIINNMENKGVQVTAQLISGLGEGLGNPINLAKGLAASQIGAAIGAYTLGGAVARYATEYGLDFADNYLSQFDEARILGKPEPTQKEALIAAGMGLGVQGTIDVSTGVAKAMVGKIKDRIKTSASGIDTNSKLNTATESSSSTPKQIAKEQIQPDLDEDVDVKLFRDKAEKDPNMKYEPSKDPRNQREDIVDKMFDNDIQDTDTSIEVKQGNKYINVEINNSTIEKFEAGKINGTIDPEIADMAKENLVLQGKINIAEGNDVDTPISLDDAQKTIGDMIVSRKKYEETIEKILDGQQDLQKLKEELGSVKEELTKRAEKSGAVKNKDIPKVDTPSHDLKQPKFVSSLNQAIEEMKKETTYHGDSLIAKENGKTSILYKESNGNVVVIEYDDTTLKPEMKDNPYIIFRSNEEMQLHNVVNTARVTVHGTDGNIYSVTGGMKARYYMKLKQYKTLQDLAKGISTSSRRYQSGKVIVGDKGEVKGSTANTARDYADTLVERIAKTKESISQNTKAYFDYLFGEWYHDRDELLRDLNPVLGELFVNGKTSADIFFKNSNLDPKKQKALEEFINYLQDLDTMLEAIKRQADIEDDLIPSVNKYILADKIFKMDADGGITYNTDVGGMFHGRDVNTTLLDMLINRDDIDKGDYKEFIKDRQHFVDMFEDNISIDRQNGMAIEVAFRGDEKKLNLLKTFGFMSDGDMLSCTKDNFLAGMDKILSELYNPNSKYNKDELLGILDTFSNHDKLPNKKVINKDGSVTNTPVTVTDFILYNKENKMVDNLQVFDLFAKYVNQLDDVLQDAVANEGKVIEINKVSLEDRDALKKQASTVLSFFNRIQKVIESDGANKYFQTEKFSKDKAKVIEVLNDMKAKGIIDDDLVDVDKISAQSYNGQVTDDNIPVMVKSNVDKLIETNTNNKAINKQINLVLDLIGKKKKLGDILNNEKYKTSINTIKEYLSNNNVPKEVIDKLDLDDAVEVRRALKDVKGNIDKFDSTLKNIETSYKEIFKKNRKTSEYVSSQKERNKLIKMINNIEDLSKAELNDIKDFVNYYGGTYDYKLDKEFIQKIAQRFRDISSKLESENKIDDFKPQKANYKTLVDGYKSFKTLVNEDVAGTSTKFIRKKEMQERLANMVKAAEELGYSADKIKQIGTMLNYLTESIDTIEESKLGSTLKKINKKYIIKYRRLTSKDALKFGRLESVIKKIKWLDDKRMYAKNTNKHSVADINFDPIEDLSEVVAGAFEKYIDPKYQLMFKNFYEYAVPFFKEVEMAVDGQVQKRPLTLDEFTYIYNQFLNALTDTTEVNKALARISSLKNARMLSELSEFFKDDDAFISFMTRRTGNVGDKYSLNNVEVIYNTLDKRAGEMAEYYHVGSSLWTFAHRLNKSNSALLDLMYKFAPEVRVKDVQFDKGLQQIGTAFFDAVGNRVKNFKRPIDVNGSVNGVNDRNWREIFTGILKPIQNILLFGGGLVEITLNPLRTLRTQIQIDAEGRYVGVKGSYNSLMKYNLAQVKALGRGLRDGGIFTGANIWNMGIGLSNMVLKLAQFARVEQAINKQLIKAGKNPIRLQIPKGVLLSPEKISRYMSKDQKIMLATMHRYFESKDFSKMREFADIDPANIKFRNNKVQYVSEALRHTGELYSQTANMTQNFADQFRWMESYKNMMSIMEDISNRSYETLPNKIKGMLTLFGIDDKNYNEFLQYLNIHKTENGFADVDLLSLQVSNNNLDPMALMWTDTIGAFAHHVFNDSFDVSKSTKYKPRDSQDLLYVIQSALRKVVTAIGQDDLDDFMYDFTQYGTYEPKTNRFKEYGTIPTIMKGAKIGLATVPVAILSYMALGMVAPIYNALGKNILSLKRELASTLGDIQTFAETFTEDDEEGNKILQGLTLFGSIFAQRVKQNIPVAVLFNSGNIYGAYNPLLEEAVKEFHNTTSGMFGWTEEDINKFWNRFGVFPDYNAIEATRQGRAESLWKFGSAFAKFGFRVPVEFAIAIKSAVSGEKDYDQINKDKRSLASRNEKTSAKALETYYKLQQGEPIPKGMETSSFVNIPSYEEMSEEGRKFYGKVMYDSLMIDKADSIQRQIKAYDLLSYSLNEIAYENEAIDEKEHEANKVELFKSMDIDNQVKKLPAIYQYAMKEILDSYDNIKESEELKIKALVVHGASTNMSITDLMNQYKNTEEIPKRKQYQSFDDLPSILKYQYQTLVDGGIDVSKTEFVERINSPSGKAWYKSFINSKGEIEYTAPTTVSSDEAKRWLQEPDMYIDLDGNVGTMEELDSMDKTTIIENKAQSNILETQTLGEEKTTLETMFNQINDKEDIVMADIGDIESPIESKEDFISDSPLEDKISFGNAEMSKDDLMKDLSSGININDISNKTDDIPKDVVQQSVENTIKDRNLSITKSLKDKISGFVNLVSESIKDSIDAIYGTKDNAKEEVQEPNTESNDDPFITFTKEYSDMIIDSPVLNQDQANTDQDSNSDGAINKEEFIDNLLNNEEFESEPIDEAYNKVIDILIEKSQHKNYGTVPEDIARQIIDVSKAPKTVQWMFEQLPKNPRWGDETVKGYFRDAGFGYLDPKNNWCTAIITAAHVNSGIKLKKNTVGAQNFYVNGKDVSINDVQAGDVMIFRNRDKNGKRTWTGHTAIVIYKDDNIMMSIGGNQIMEGGDPNNDYDYGASIRAYDINNVIQKLPSKDISIIRIPQ